MNAERHCKIPALQNECTSKIPALLEKKLDAEAQRHRDARDTRDAKDAGCVTCTVTAVETREMARRTEYPTRGSGTRYSR
jgi:hypothetical protein